MLTTHELLALLGDLESDRVERTVAARDTDKLAQAVCAFANDLPAHGLAGYLLVGARDDGQLSGLGVDDELLQTLAGLRSDGNIQPLPALTVERHALPNGDVAVVRVLPADLPPVWYRGRVWIRVGPRKATASEQEERVLVERRVAAARTFDAQPCTEATLDELRQARFELDYLPRAVAPEVIAENNRSFKHKLASLRFWDLRRDSPTNAGLLVLCDRPTHFLPGAYVQFVRYAGVEQSAAVAYEKRATGDLATVLQTLDLLLHVQVGERPVAQTAMRESLLSDYPPIALREFLVNAVQHRNYASNGPVRVLWFDDRVVIHNPGGLYGDATAATFPNAVDYRNPVVAEATRVLGYANRFGQGVVRAQKALAYHGNPPAEFAMDAHQFSVTVRKG